MKLEIGSAAASASPTTAPAAKLQVARGVFQVAGQFGAQPTVRLDVKDAALAMADQFSVAGVAGAIRFSDLSPAQTPPGQRLIASSLKVGPLELTDGAVEFQVTGSTLNVRQTQWLAFGGSVWASDVAIAPGAPIKATLHASNIDLKSLLDAFAQGKASGEGRISGELPVVINGSNVEFGDGHATSSGGGGMVQVKDRSTLAAVAAGAGASAGNLTQKEQLERNIVEALSDFQYDQLTTRLDSRPGGQLDAHIRMSGHGRTGAKQALDYELNVNRLDLAIKSYFGVNQAMNAPKNAATRATGKALTP